jgi:hypothetical protein
MMICDDSRDYGTVHLTLCLYKLWVVAGEMCEVEEVDCLSPTLRFNFILNFESVLAPPRFQTHLNKYHNIILACVPKVANESVVTAL